MWEISSDPQDVFVFFFYHGYFVLHTHPSYQGNIHPDLPEGEDGAQAQLGRCHPDVTSEPLDSIRCSDWAGFCKPVNDLASQYWCD